MDRVTLKALLCLTASAAVLREDQDQGTPTDEPRGQNRTVINLDSTLTGLFNTNLFSM